ncbi:MAG: SdiA-regulated domain-containing protein [Bacteroidota bacterium]
MYYFLIIFCSYILNNQKIIDYTAQSKIDIEEPSDIFFDIQTHHYFIVSDEGTLKVKDEQMKTIHTLKKKGADFEAICVVDSFIYISEESSKRILQYDMNSYELVNTYDIHNFGSLNAGIEGLTYNKKTNTFFASYEKEPTAIIEFDIHFNQIRKVILKDVSDISSLYYYNNYLYVLSDEDASLLKFDPTSLHVVDKIKFKIINAEGVSFVDDNTFLIVSDASQKIYTFKYSF